MRRSISGRCPACGDSYGTRTAATEVAAVEFRLGALDPRPGAEVESRAALERARGLYEALIQSDAQTVRYQSGLALTYEYIGNRWQQQGNTEEGLMAYRKALAVSEKTLRSNPGHMPSVNGALVEEQTIASWLALTGDRGGALDYAGRAVERAERLVRATETPGTRIRLAQAYEAMAGVRKQLGDWAEARAGAVRAAAEWRNFTGGDSHEADVARMEQMIAECDRHVNIRNQANRDFQGTALDRAALKSSLCSRKILRRSPALNECLHMRHRYFLVLVKNLRNRSKPVCFRVSNRSEPHIVHVSGDFGFTADKINFRYHL